MTYEDVDSSGAILLREKTSLQVNKKFTDEPTLLLMVP
jgi:hypothetical protein